MVWRISPDITQNFSPRLHSLHEFNGKALERGLRQAQGRKSSVGERYIQSCSRLVVVPQFTSGHLAGKLEDEFPAGLGSTDVQEKEASKGKGIASQHESLNIGGVQFAHIIRLRILVSVRFQASGPAPHQAGE